MAPDQLVRNHSTARRSIYRKPLGWMCKVHTSLKHDDKLSESSTVNQVVPEIISVEVSEAHYLHYLHYFHPPVECTWAGESLSVSTSDTGRQVKLHTEMCSKLMPILCGLWRAHTWQRARNTEQVKEPLYPDSTSCLLAQRRCCVFTGDFSFQWDKLCCCNKLRDASGRQIPHTFQFFSRLLEKDSPSQWLC